MKQISIIRLYKVGGIRMLRGMIYCVYFVAKIQDMNPIIKIFCLNTCIYNKGM